PPGSLPFLKALPGELSPGRTINFNIPLGICFPYRQGRSLYQVTELLFTFPQGLLSIPAFCNFKIHTGNPNRYPILIVIIMAAYFHPVNSIIGPAYAYFKNKPSGFCSTYKSSIKYGIILL